jgi:hypothetical protein
LNFKNLNDNSQRDTTNIEKLISDLQKEQNNTKLSNKKYVTVIEQKNRSE